MTRRVSIIVIAGAAASLGGCDRLGAAWTAFQTPKAASVTAPAAETPSAPPAATPAVAPLTPTSRGLPVKALPDPQLQSAASVVEVHPLAEVTGMDGKIFGLAGGDPAMNGLQTYIAFYRSPADGWWVYQIGDFLSFKVLNQSLGQVDLEVEESTLNDATGTIGKRTRRIIVAFTVAPAEEQPVSVRFMPAG